MSQPDNRKKKIRWTAAWELARSLLWARRWRLSFGLLLMLIGRLASLVPPYLSKSLIDDVAQQGRVDLQPRLALMAGAATVVQAVTSFGLSQILGVAAQKAITDMRRRVAEHVMHGAELVVLLGRQL